MIATTTKQDMLRKYSHIKSDGLAEIHAAVLDTQKYFQGIVLLAHPV